MYTEIEINVIDGLVEVHILSNHTISNAPELSLNALQHALDSGFIIGVMLPRLGF